MNFIQFESARDKEKARNDLREARAQMLQQAEQRANDRLARDRQQKLRGDDQLLPSVDAKIKSLSDQLKPKKAQKKHKKEKKSKSKKKKRKKSSSSSSDSESKQQQTKFKEYSDSESSTEDEWVERTLPGPPNEPRQREDWLSGMLIPTYSKEVKVKEPKQKMDTYDPQKSARELNPHWKDGGTGLPSQQFKRPNEDSDEEQPTSSRRSVFASSSGNWRKKEPQPKRRTPSPKSTSSSEAEEPPEKSPVTTLPAASDFLSDQQMNELGAKIVKAEILGNEVLAKQLKEKLEKARESRNRVDDAKQEKKKEEGETEEEVVVLTKSNHRGNVKPLEQRARPSDPYGRSNKSKKMPTHVDGERVRFFADDDRYNLKTMFESEKFATTSDQDAQFMKLAGRKTNARDDMEDIFAEQAQRTISDVKMDEKERAQVIREHQETTKLLENCERCFNSSRMEKQLIVALGSNVYLALSPFESLQFGQCQIVPMAHASCSTQLDEDVWAEITEFRKALTRMFESHGQEVIFFETARYLHRQPHMVINAVPSREFEMAPFYFKKAIQESEREWSMNRQLVDLKKEKKDLRRAIPKGLPYFWVNFGMDQGFAHVIEEQERFPRNFAEEIIGGMLSLDARLYRKPRKEHNMASKLKQFYDWWKPFDFTTN